MKPTGKSKNVYETDKASGQIVKSGQHGPFLPRYPGSFGPPAPLPHGVQFPIQQGSQETIDILRAYLQQMQARRMWEDQMRAWQQANGIWSPR